MSTLSRVVLLAAPASPSATVISSSRIDLSWTSVVGAVSYRVYRAGVLVDLPTATTSSSTGLSSSTLYSFQVAAVDAAGLEGPKGSQFTGATLAAPDVTAPSVPVIAVTTLSSSSQQVTLTTASTDTGGSGLASYTLERATNAGFTANLTTEATGLSIFPRTVTGLSSSTQYFYRARATDGASNTSANSTAVNATTSSSSSSGFSTASGIGFSGSFSDGQSVTFTRAAGGFGTKTNAKPLYYFPLETDLNPHPTLSRTTTVGALAPHSTAVIQTGLKPVNAAGAARVRACASNRQSPPPILFMDAAQFSTDQFYCFIKRAKAHPMDFPAYSVKMGRLWSTNGVGGNQPDLYWGSETNTYFEGIDPGSAPFYSNAGGSTVNTWYTDEHIYIAGTLNNTDGIVNFWRDGIIGYTTATRRKTKISGTVFGGGPGSAALAYWFLDEYSYNPGPGVVDIDSLDYFHCAYFDDSPKRILTAPSSTITASGTSQQHEIMIPTAWSDTSVTCTVRQGSWPTLVGKHVHLFTDAYTSIYLGVGT